MSGLRDGRDWTWHRPRVDSFRRFYGSVYSAACLHGDDEPRERICEDRREQSDQGENRRAEKAAADEADGDERERGRGVRVAERAARLRR